MRTILQVLIGVLILGAIGFIFFLVFQYKTVALIVLGIPIVIFLFALAKGIGRRILGDDKNDPPSYDV